MAKAPQQQEMQHPLIVGTALFRTKDGWRAGYIRTRDPSVFAHGSLTEPNMKGITMGETKKLLASAWEDDA